MILIVVMLRIVREGGCGEGRRGAGPAVITAGVGAWGRRGWGCCVEREGESWKDYEMES